MNISAKGGLTIVNPPFDHFVGLMTELSNQMFEKIIGFIAL
jgi:hypothetical protein